MSSLQAEAARAEPTGHQVRRANLDRFLSELTRVSHDCGIGIVGQPELVVLEREDYLFSYTADNDSRLVLR